MAANEALRNPFVVGRYVAPRYFCDREEETDFLRKSVENGRDVALISPRRLGKSGLIEHFFGAEEIRKQYITIYIDIYSTSTVAELVTLLGRAVFREITKQRSGVWQQLVDALRSLRPSISVDPITGEPSLSLTSASVRNPELTLSEIFEYLETAPKPCIVAIDEFQEIGTYDNKKTEGLLRGFIQRATRTRFIFAGSAHSMMDTMFNSPQKPLYQSCVTMGLKPIPEDKYVDFAMRQFADYGKRGHREIIRRVYQEVNGVTWFLQMLLNELFALTAPGEELSENSIALAERNIIGVQDYNYREIMNRLTARQRDLAQYLASKGGVDNILSADSVQESGFRSAASLQSALKGLERAGLLNRTGNTTALYDIFFAIWLRNNC